ncbi:hypothetical protein HDU99_002608, partial [Rhizoclosmatium hyalinum]
MSSASIALLFLSILILQCTTAPAPFPEVLSDLSQIYNNITSNDPAPVNGPSPSNNGTITPALGFAYLWSRRKIKSHLVTRQLSPAAGIGGAALVMTGFAYAFMGKRAYFPSLFLSGFYTIGLITFVLLDICQMKWHSFGPYADWIYLLLIAPMAVGGGFAFQKFSQVGIVCMGALNGFVWSCLFLFTGLGSSLAQSTHLIFTLAVIGMGTATVFFMEHMALVIGTAFVGGMVSVGTDLFACAG